MNPVAAPTGHRPVLITGGAGFVGCNLADRLAGDGWRVVVFDNLSRPGVERNLAWLRQRHGERIEVVLGDVRDRALLRAAVDRAAQVFHFAAQVAVTTSIADPELDFEVNLRGTFNLLEAIRAQAVPPSLVFASTNKVYGKLGIDLIEAATRHVPAEPGPREAGIAEDHPLELWSPYGCSKGGADQYVLDYARVYGLPAAVFRMSCLYGPRQFGTEDQGWVAHFAISALAGQPITVFGDGKQVRDVLFIDDVVEAFLLAQTNMAGLKGRAFNIGGGPRNSVSLLELLAMIARLAKRRPKVTYGGWRPGDQLYYVSDTRRFAAVTGWQPRVGVEAGLARLLDWLRAGAAPSGESEAEGVAV